MNAAVLALAAAPAPVNPAASPAPGRAAMTSVPAMSGAMTRVTVVAGGAV